jgi:hypothetical protein
MRLTSGSRIALLGLLLGASAGPVAARAQSHCVEDALGDVHCARDPLGVAVIDTLGVARCAAGRCVEKDDEWHCSTESGGEARLEPAGPVCAGSCAAPKSTDCVLEPD